METQLLSPPQSSQIFARKSLALSLACLPESARKKFLRQYSDKQLLELWYTWAFWARDEQVAPGGNWTIWFYCAGRGAGKTRSGAEYIRSCVEHSKRPIRVALVAKTPADARDVMVQGVSGLLTVCPPWNRPEYVETKRKLVWPNGSLGYVYSSAEYDTLRGPAHHFAWCDELASWHYPQQTWDNLMLGLRLGEHPKCVVTSTPRPIALIRELLSRVDKDVALSTGSTYDNRANLPEAFFQEIVSKYEGTTLGQQELHAQVISDVPGALWTRATLDTTRLTQPARDMYRIVVAIDPPASSGEDSAECGITAGGRGEDGHAYLLDDCSMRASPDRWAREAVALYHVLKADLIVAEANQGGEMVRHTIRTVDANVPVKLVHATKGKHTRAEPVAALYEQGKCHHIGYFGELEDQLCTWKPGAKSPDRLDSLVWLMTELMLEGRAPGDMGVLL